MIKYIDLGADKQLHEIVVAGSHDAGITGGGSNVQAQNLDIAGQAAAGIRVFDLRIAAAALPGKHDGDRQVELRAFHADKKLMFSKTKTRFVPELGRAEDVKRTKLPIGGAFGQGLAGMLAGARDFVAANPSEFLILKFDKSSNWGLIAELCVSVLGDTIYKDAGNINTRTLGDLAGKVIVCFTGDGVQAVSATHPRGSGIHGIRNLFDKSGTKGYLPDYDGIQYFGKGGTSVFKPFGKIGQNISKQRKLLRMGGDAEPEVLGMMYWTTTGVSESIRKRNDTMWTKAKITSLGRLWEGGLSDAIYSRLARNFDPYSYAGGQALKVFMPNIVMIDFADAEKCRTIYNLNFTAATALSNLADSLEFDPDLAVASYTSQRRKGGKR